MYMNPNRVEFDLKPHNEQTIKRILEFYKTSNKCCAIQATGTGKTFLILRLLEIFNDINKKAIIFAPNREIIKQTRSKMKKFDLTNARFYTYQKLASLTEDQIKMIEADLIVCDELHRTGAKTWGEKFEYLVSVHPESKVFGVTATPLRCADGRDMADEYFDGNRACNISLAEALVRKIIPIMPVYVSALYTFDEEYDNMVRKIQNGRNSDEEKINLTKELNLAKRKLEKSIGVPEIIKKYITNYDGKYIVFCKDKKHLYSMKDVVIQWFRDAGYLGEIYEYPYYSNNSTVRKNLTNFKENNNKGLKLLFVIDKLNEGLHLDVIHGCILLRSTTSNIIYYQQIGRAIDAGSNEKRVILDLVSNFNSLKTFNLKDELNIKIKERENGYFPECSKVFDVKEFHINDLIQNCIDIFMKIDQRINNISNNFNNEEWTKEEIEIIRNNYAYGKDNVTDLLKNRSWSAIKCMAHRLGIKQFDCGYWSDEEENKFRDLFAEYGAKAYYMMPNRSYKSCASKRRKMNLKYNKSKSTRTLFSNEEDNIIMIQYPKMGRECYKLLDNKTAEQVKSRAKILGVKRTYKRKYKYVTFHKLSGKYHVSFSVNGKVKSFGYYDSEDLAGKVAIEKALEYGKAV